MNDNDAQIEVVIPLEKRHFPMNLALQNSIGSSDLVNILFYYGGIKQ